MKVFTFTVVLIALLPATFAAASSPIPLSPDQVTGYTDVWIHGRILSVSGPVTKDDPFGGNFRDITLRLKIIDSTDKAFSGVVKFRDETTHHGHLNKGNEVFAAFQIKGGELVPRNSLGSFNGWKTVDADTGMMSTRVGPVDTAVYWRFLQGIRNNVDTGGEPSDAERAYWQGTLSSDDQGQAWLSKLFFRTVVSPPNVAKEILDSFFEVYEATAVRLESALKNNENTHKDTRVLRQLISTLPKSIQATEINDVGTALVDFIVYDASKLKVLGDRAARRVWLGMVQKVTDPKVLARLPDIYDAHIRPDYTAYTLLPSAPSEEVDAWLWDIVRDPAAYEIRSALDLAGVYNAMANREMEGALPYLKRVASGEEVPSLQGRDPDASNIMTYARETLAPLEKKAVPREERLAEWVQRFKGGDASVLGELRREITPEDRSLIPELAKLTAAHWRKSNGEPALWPAAEIMQQLPDPAFLPVLRQLARQSFDWVLLKPLVACGGKDTAVELAVDALSADIPRDDLWAMRNAVSEREEVILFLGEMKEPSLAEHFLAYTDRETLEQLEETYVGLAKDQSFPSFKKPYPVWELRDAALVALAKSNHPEAVSRLERAYEVEDIRGRFVSAFALYALGNDTGIELVNAYRDRQERAIPEAEKRWYVDFAGGNIFRKAIVYLKNPKLDQLYFTRTEKGFGQEDHDLAQNPEFVGRYRREVMNMLLSHIDDPNMAVRSTVIGCLKRNTGQDFGFTYQSTATEQHAAIKKWKEYMAAL